MGWLARLLSLPAQPPSRPSTDLSDVLRPPQDFGPSCARLSAPAWGSAWGRGGLMGEPGGSLRARRSPASWARPAPPASGSVLCRPRAGAAPRRFLRGRGTKLKPLLPAPGTKPGLPSTLSHLPREEGAGRRPSFQIAAARGWPPGQCCGGERPGAVWWAQKTLRGARSPRRDRYFLQPAQPLAAKPGISTACRQSHSSLCWFGASLSSAQGPATRALGEVPRDALNPISRKSWAVRMK